MIKTIRMAANVVAFASTRHRKVGDNQAVIEATVDVPVMTGELTHIGNLSKVCTRKMPAQERADVSLALGTIALAVYRQDDRFFIELPHEDAIHRGPQSDPRIYSRLLNNEGRCKHLSAFARLLAGCYAFGEKTLFECGPLFVEGDLTKALYIPGSPGPLISSPTTQRLRGNSKNFSALVVDPVPESIFDPLFDLPHPDIEKHALAAAISIAHSEDPKNKARLVADYIRLTPTERSIQLQTYIGRAQYPLAHQAPINTGVISEGFTVNIKLAEPAHLGDGHNALHVRRCEDEDLGEGVVRINFDCKLIKQESNVLDVAEEETFTL